MGIDEIVSSRIIMSEDKKFATLSYQSDYKQGLEHKSVALKQTLEPRTRYYWKVEAKINNKQTNENQVCESEVAFFETGKETEPWIGEWVGVKGENVEASPLLRKKFTLKSSLKEARLYVLGLGLYECYMNGNYVNDGFLQPGFHNYHYWKQYQTYDVTAFLEKENVIGFSMGAGWYKGRFGVNGGFENNFGEDYKVIWDLYLVYEDGTKEQFGSDETMEYIEGPVQFSNIYDGEVYDGTKEIEHWSKNTCTDTRWRSVSILPEESHVLTERYSVPMNQKGILKGIILTKTKDKVIIDFGQNNAGWVVFDNFLKKGECITIKHAEHMEKGAISTKNLLTAKQEFTYTSNGRREQIRPHFTYFGFRYIQIEGNVEAIENIKDGMFIAWNLYSDLETTGILETGNDKINRLIQNAFWSQKGNFLDHPSDCPQRAERLGWTGDAQMYCKTASYFMDTYSFYKKYMKDINEEQKHRDGMVPFIIPKIAGRGFEESKEDEVSAAWSDATTIIPWNLYLYYGDKQLLETHYIGMKQWVSYIIRKDKENGDKKLWQTGFHFGDWLALDNQEPGPFGKTDPFFIASCYYYYSTLLVAKAAKVLNKVNDYESYHDLSQRIKKAIQQTYFDEQGVCTIQTQTAYILSIYMELVEIQAQEKNGVCLEKKIIENGYHLDTGFVGTPYICFALAKIGKVDLAYKLLFQEQCPGWLYQVNQGATTIWESWDCIDKERTIQNDSSLNHYTFGSIVEWLFAYSAGIRPMEEFPGFEKVWITPKTQKQLGHLKGTYKSLKGTYCVAWERSENKVNLSIQVPLGCTAFLQLETQDNIKELTQGTHSFEYKIEEANGKG